MQFSTHQLSQLLQGEVEGNPDIFVSNLAKIEEAKEGDLSFIAHPKYVDFAYTTNASILIVDKSVVFSQPVKASLIWVQNARTSFAQLLHIYEAQFQPQSGVSELAHVDETAKIGQNVYVGAFAYVGKNVVLEDNVKIYSHVYLAQNVTIGKNTSIYAGVKVYHSCTIGNNCIIHANTVIGSDGFGFAPQEDGTYQKVPQIGNVVIEDEVEIGANVTIDRATMGKTHIKKGVKLDNLIQIAHNVVIGENTVIAAQTGVSGSTQLGENCLIGGQVGFVGHLKIAQGTKINAKSGISKSIKEPKQAWNGIPAFSYRDSLRAQAVFKKLPDLLKRVRQLEKELENYKK